MSEITTSMSARDIGAKVGLSNVEARSKVLRPSGTFDEVSKRYSDFKARDLVDAVIDARLAGRESQKSAMEIHDEQLIREVIGMPKLEESEFLSSVKEEEVAIIAGEKNWEDRVVKFLGTPSREADASVDGDLGEKSTGSFAKLEKMKGRAAATFETLTEIAKEVGADSVIDARNRWDGWRNEFDSIQDDQVELTNDVLTDLMFLDENHQGKILNKLGLSIDDISFEPGDVQAMEDFSDKLKTALNNLSERTEDGRGVTLGVKFDQFTRRFGRDNQLVKRWVDRKISVDDREEAYNSEMQRNYDNYVDFGNKLKDFNKSLVRIANREEVNSTIVGVVGEKIGSERAEHQRALHNRELLEEQDRLAGERIAHNDRLEAAKELVSTELQIKELKAYAKGQEDVVRSTVEALGKAKVLGGQRDSMLAELAKGKLPEQVAAVVGGEAYKSVAKFIETNGVEGDPAQVTAFLEEVKSLMGDKGKLVGGREIVERAEFMPHTTVVVGGKSVEVGMVVGVATDKQGTWTISTAQRDAEGKITPDTNNVLYLNHEKINGYVEAVKATEASLRVFEAEMRASDGAATIAGSESMADQHVGNELDISEVVDQAEKLLSAQRGLLAGSLRPMGGKDDTLAVALENMSKGQQMVVENFYNVEYVKTVSEVAEKLKMKPEEVTPAVLAVAHAEAVQTGRKATEIIEFLDKHDERMAEAVAASGSELAKLASSIVDLQQDKSQVLVLKDPVVRQFSLESIKGRETEVKNQARAISDAIEAGFVARTPEALRAKRPNIKWAVIDDTLLDNASTLLREVGLEEYVESIGLVAGEVIEGSGMAEELARQVVVIRDALSVITDPRSQTLQRALNSGDPEAMFVRINEVLKGNVESELAGRREVEEGSGERREIAEMSPKEFAEAIVTDDSELDELTEASFGLPVEKAREMLEALQLVRGSVGIKARAEYVARVSEGVQELLLGAGGSLERLKEQIGDNNPETWVEILSYAEENLDGPNQNLVTEALRAARELADEKKNSKLESI